MLERVERKPPGTLCRWVAELIRRITMGDLVKHEGGNEAQEAADNVGNIEHISQCTLMLKP